MSADPAHYNALPDGHAVWGAFSTWERDGRDLRAGTRLEGGLDAFVPTTTVVRVDWGGRSLLGLRDPGAGWWRP